MNVFTSGIVWDPREPLPPEFEHNTTATNAQIDTISSVESKFSSAPKVKRQLPQSNEKLFNNVIKQPAYNLLPPLSASTDVHIVQDTARVTVSQIFWNDADTRIHQGSYTFPLPNGCTVTSFSCRLGREKILRAEAHPKDEAREAFQKAVEERHVRALLEQNTPEIFTASLGIIPPNTRLRAELTYIQLLKHRFSSEKNITTFTLPTAIASRYGDPPAEIAQVTSQGSQPSSMLQVKVTDADKIAQITSDTHKIQVEHHPSKGKVSKWDGLADYDEGSGIQTAMVKLCSTENFLGKDFIINIETESSTGLESSHAWVESHPVFKNQMAMIVTIPPSFVMTNERIGHGEVLFLVDRYGSMADKMDTLKLSMMFLHKGIPVGRKFNVWSFGSCYESIWEKSQLYNEWSLEEALYHVQNKFQANLGGTELLASLDAMLKAADLLSPCDIIILTDGEVWRLEEILKLVKNTRESSVRFFALGIGTHVSHALVEGIAMQGGGYSEVIPKACRDGWEDRIVAMLKAALTDHVGSLKVNLSHCSFEEGVLTSPPRMEGLNLFQINRMFWIFTTESLPEGMRSITLEASQLDGTRLCKVIPLDILENTDTVIHNLAARAIIGDLELPLPADVTSRGQAAYTIFVMVLLERDFQHHKSLWDLIQMKAANYISGKMPDAVKKSEIIELAKKELNGKGFILPNPSPPAESSRDTTDVSSRSVIDIAPLD
ncbi:von Willebrand factor type A domain-containing protein [Whalleya microplaca]|nr:von Willebrand factor type A domain-containing protein [Whalleya microplaca]